VFVRGLFAFILAAALSACTREPAVPARSAPVPASQNVIVITIDTLRADHVGAYGYAAARTPALDRLAREGVRYDRAYAAAPITLPSHASLMTGRYPPGHGARHNGMRMDLKTLTLADAFAAAGYKTAAFVAAFPLDRRFGLIKGFQTYGDVMPRDTGGRLANERPGRLVVDEALAWLSSRRQDKFFLWIHLFEPHAPYGNAATGRTVSARYDDDIAEADAQVGRLLDGLGPLRSQTLIVATSDHGEAFGEHGEISHSLFVYDTTLRVPLIFAGAGLPANTLDSSEVSLVDVAPTVASLAGLARFEADGMILPAPDSPREVPYGRALYAESFAPLLDFGWSALRTIRRLDWKYVAAPKPELYDLKNDPAETRNLVAEQPARAADFKRQVDAMSTAELTASGAAPDLSAAASAQADREARARLQALGYASGRPAPAGDRPDPKDRRELAARIARVASGELQGTALERTLREIIREDPGNPQANLRLGYALMNSGRCEEAMTRFTAAIEARLPSADAHLGRAGCEVAQKQSAAARKTLNAAQAIEPDNPVVSANLGLLLSDAGDPAAGIPHLERALALDPDLHQARFALAVAYARTDRRPAAAKEAQELLRRLPPGAPQRPEIERLLAAVRPPSP
jgi:choline-sulfatase